MAPTKQSQYSSRAKPSKNREQDDLQTMRDIADDVIESDFVPYACLYDPATIVTKDGELLQTIKITGLGFESAASGDLRGAIRQAINKCLPDDSYAIWLHTLRRRQTHVATSEFPDNFSAQVDEAWKASHPASTFFVNELYISVVKAGEPAKLRDRKTLLQSLSPKLDRTLRTKELDRMHVELTNTTQAMLGILNASGARLLTVVERDGVFYSEQIEFLEKLINLEERPMPVPERDLSQVLTSGEITFGFNAMEVRTADEHRRFAAILTLKEYKESTLNGIDQFLEIPCEVIVTQCFSFTGAEASREAYAKLARYLTISGDKELAKWIEIDRLMQGDGAARQREFGEQQTSLFLIAPSVKQLETNVRMVQRALNKLGMVVIREDLRFEECYWAQLPGNFPFVCRKRPIDTQHIAGFANLQSAPMGIAGGSVWGPPVSIFSTVQNAPYFFNFHRAGNAHTVVLGKPGAGRTSFTHFLLAQARRLPISIWYLDARGRAEQTIKAMGGQYLAPGTPALRLNPFQLPETPANHEFLALWFSTLIDPYGNNLNASSLSFFKSLVTQLLQLPRDQRRLSLLLPIARDADPLLGQSLARFCAGGEYGELFDMPTDTFTPGALTGWDISRWMKDPLTRIPLTAYLLHRLTTQLDGKPTLIVLDEGFKQLDNPLFASRAAGWCDYLTQKNAACMFITDDIGHSGAIPFTPSVMQKVATLFAFGDTMPDAEYQMGFGFTPTDISSLIYIAKSNYHVLQKRGTETTVLRMDLAGLSDAARMTLSGKAAAPTSPADHLAELMGYKPA